MTGFRPNTAPCKCPRKTTPGTLFRQLWKSVSQTIKNMSLETPKTCLLKR